MGRTVFRAETWAALTSLVQTPETEAPNAHPLKNAGGRGWEEEKNAPILTRKTLEDTDITTDWKLGKENPCLTDSLMTVMKLEGLVSHLARRTLTCSYRTQVHQGFHENDTHLKEKDTYPLLIMLTGVMFPLSPGHLSWWESTLPSPTRHRGVWSSGLGAGPLAFLPAPESRLRSPPGQRIRPRKPGKEPPFPEHVFCPRCPTVVRREPSREAVFTSGLRFTERKPRLNRLIY